jgi:hypothetical protein
VNRVSDELGEMGGPQIAEHSACTHQGADDAAD